MNTTKMRYATFLLFILLLSSWTYAQKLSANEKKLVHIIDQQLPAAFTFIEKVVNINSGTFNKEGVRMVGDLYKKELDAIGFTTQWIDMPPAMNRAGHLFAEVKGTKGKHILLIGHLDTVFEPDSPFQKYQLQDSIATGPGTSDMKGGNTVLLFALKALYQANLLKDTQIIVAMHGDEENAGDPISISRKAIIDAAKRSDVALAYEDATKYDQVTIARRGSSDWKLVVHGKQAHSSLIFSDDVGAGAIYEASRILYRFYSELPEDLLTFNPGLIAGGTKVFVDSTGTSGTTSGKDNIIANTVIVQGDLRFISEEQKATARKKMQAIVADHLPNTSAEITFGDSYPAMPPTDGNMKLLNQYSKVSMDLGMGEVKPFDPGKRGAGDISFVAQYVDALDGLGVEGGGGHSLSEYMGTKTVGDQIKRTALLLYRLTR